MARSAVYFGYLGDEQTEPETVRRRLAFMDSQLQWLADLIGLTDQPIDVLVPYVAPRAWDAEVHHAVTCRGFRIDVESVEADRRNRFEYPGFRAMQAVARHSPPDDLIYYCHSKGISELSQAKMGLFRLHTAVGLTADLAGLTTDPAATRAGLFPARGGWCWFNFFWIKAGYMAGRTVEESADRYAFEALIGDPRDKEGYRGVLPLIDRVPFDEIGIAPQPWYRADQTISPALLLTHQRYAAMARPPAPPVSRRSARSRH